MRCEAQCVVCEIEEISPAEHVLVQCENDEVTLGGDGSDGMPSLLPELSLRRASAQQEKREKYRVHEIPHVVAHGSL
jgi:hypothetical protein